MNDHAKLLGRDFESFVRMAFRDENGGQELGDEPYIAYVYPRIRVRIRAIPARPVR
jgi:hypothetical protein